MRIVPGILLAGSGALGVLVWLPMGLFSIWGTTVALEGRGRDEDLLPLFVSLLVASPIYALFALIISLCGFGSAAGSRSAGIVGAALLLLPCTSPLGVLGLVVGLMVLVLVMRDREG